MPKAPAPAPAEAPVDNIVYDSPEANDVASKVNPGPTVLLEAGVTTKEVPKFVVPETVKVPETVAALTIDTASESKTIFPLLYVLSVRSEELKISPA